MKRRSRNRGRLIPAFALCFAAGIAIGWWLRGGPPAPATIPAAAASDQQPTATIGATPIPPVHDAAATPPERAKPSAAGVDDLMSRHLRIPIDGADVERLKGMFAEPRDAGGRAHEAVDILAPRNTPVHAVEDGTIAKLFYSKAGGITIYQFDTTQRFCYYYAHLQRYTPDLKEGQRVSRGDVIGFVGTSGNAPANTPHLHFAIFELGPDHRWWEGRPIDPYPVLRR